MYINQNYITIKGEVSMAKLQHINQSVSKDIYTAGYQNSKSNEDLPDNKHFFEILRNAVINELELTGFCELIDCLIESKSRSIDVIVYSVFADIANGYESNEMIDIDDLKQSEYIPYATKWKHSTEWRWEECEKMNQKNLPLSDNVIETLRTARQSVRLAHIQKYVEKELDEPESYNESENNEAEKILEQARAEAQELVDEAKKEASRINEEAQNTAETIIENAKEQAKELSSALVSTHIADAQRNYKKEFNEEMEKFSDLYFANTRRAATIHGEMCDSTNAFQAEWVHTLNEAVEQLNAIKSEFYAHLHDWQVSLYPTEIRPLAERFLELYRIINVDKLLREEIVFQLTSDSNVDDMTSKEIALPENKHLLESPTVVSGLQRLNKTLTTFLRRFEVSLNGLDLYVYYPKPGERFDEICHIIEDEECTGNIISECVVPGIAKKANDSYGDDILIPAIVRTKMER